MEDQIYDTLTDFLREDISKQQAIDRILAKHQELIKSTDRG